jgi:alpha-ribazole phosphatase
MKEITVYLVRHCEPELPSDHICLGIRDIPLSLKGISHALKLKSYFSDKGIEAIYSSPLKRARKTAEIIADNKIRIEIKNDFSEINMGKWDGMTFAEIKEKYPLEYEERGKDFENYVVEGGESMSMCRDRALRQLKDIMDNSEGKIIIVAHAGVNRLIISGLTGMSIKDSFLYQLKYGSIIRLKYDGDISKIDNEEIHI